MTVNDVGVLGYFSVVGALLYGLIDPHFGLTKASLALVVGLFVFVQTIMNPQSTRYGGDPNANLKSMLVLFIFFTLVANVVLAVLPTAPSARSGDRSGGTGWVTTALLEVVLAPPCVNAAIEAA